jgi:hypothetical protein
VVFEARDRGLRGERLSVDGIAAEQQIVHRIVREPIGVVRILLLAGACRGRSTQVGLSAETPSGCRGASATVTYGFCF